MTEIPNGAIIVLAKIEKRPSLWIDVEPDRRPTKCAPSNQAWSSMRITRECSHPFDLPLNKVIPSLCIKQGSESWVLTNAIIGLDDLDYKEYTVVFEGVKRL